VVVEPRGAGESDGAADASFEAFAGDLTAVADALGLERFALFVRGGQGHFATQYRDAHRDRVAVVLADAADAKAIESVLAVAHRAPYTRTADKLTVEDGGLGGLPLLFVSDGKAPLLVLEATRFARRALLVELPGHGAQKPAADGNHSVDAQARALAAALDALRIDKLALAGAGLGAPVAIALAAGQPQRIVGLLVAEKTCGSTGPTLEPARDFPAADKLRSFRGPVLAVVSQGQEGGLHAQIPELERRAIRDACAADELGRLVDVFAAAVEKRWAR